MKEIGMAGARSQQYCFEFNFNKYDLDTWGETRTGEAYKTRLLCHSREPGESLNIRTNNIKVALRIKEKPF